MWLIGSGLTSIVNTRELLRVRGREEFDELFDVDFLLFSLDEFEASDECELGL